MRIAAALAGTWLASLAVAIPSPAHQGTASPDVAGQKVRLVECQQQIGVFGLEAEDAAPFLPDGFAPVPFQDSSPAGPTGAPSPPGATATVQLMATSCTPASDQGIPARPVTVAQAWLYVDPPDQYESADLGPTPSPYVVVPWMVTSGRELGRRLGAWGLPATVGAATSEFGGIAGSLQTGTVLADDGNSVIRVDSALPALVRDTTPERLRLFGVTNRRVTGVVDFVEDAHTHLLGGVARATVGSGVPGFPVPSAEGVAIHVEPGYGMSWARIAGGHTPAPTRSEPAPDPAPSAPTATPPKHSPTCAGGRVTLRLPRTVERARVRFGKRHFTVRRRRGRLVASAPASGLPRGVIKVRVQGRSRGGRRVKLTRPVRTCA